MQTADVVIVGGGVNGASTAFHLAQAGMRKAISVGRRDDSFSPSDEPSTAW